jgi:hypothetical protein
LTLDNPAALAFGVAGLAAGEGPDVEESFSRRNSIAALPRNMLIRRRRAGMIGVAICGAGWD